MHTELITLFILLVAVDWETGIDVIKMQSRIVKKIFNYFEILQHAFSSCFLINEIHCTLNNYWCTLCCSLHDGGSGLNSMTALPKSFNRWVGA